jgi:hypothetical protein
MSSEDNLTEFFFIDAGNQQQRLTGSYDFTEETKVLMQHFIIVTEAHRESRLILQISL